MLFRSDERALADAIRTLILDPPSDLIERGVAHAARFSWDRTARETLGVYETLLKRGSRLDPTRRLIESGSIPGLPARGDGQPAHRPVRGHYR